MYEIFLGNVALSSCFFTASQIQVINATLLLMLLVTLHKGGSKLSNFPGLLLILR